VKAWLAPLPVSVAKQKPLSIYFSNFAAADRRFANLKTFCIGHESVLMAFRRGISGRGPFDTDRRKRTKRSVSPQKMVTK